MELGGLPAPETIHSENGIANNRALVVAAGVIIFLTGLICLIFSFIRSYGMMFTFLGPLFIVVGTGVFILGLYLIYRQKKRRLRIQRRNRRLQRRRERMEQTRIYSIQVQDNCEPDSNTMPSVSQNGAYTNPIATEAL